MYEGFLRFFSTFECQVLLIRMGFPHCGGGGGDVPVTETRLMIGKKHLKY